MGPSGHPFVRRILKWYPVPKKSVNGVDNEPVYGGRYVEPDQTTSVRPVPGRFTEMTALSRAGGVART